MNRINPRSNRHVNRGSFLMLAVAPIAAIFSASAVHAATDTWTPPAIPTDNNWLTASNWGGVAPTSGNDVLVFAGTNNTNTNNNFLNATFAGLTFSPTAGTFTLGGNAMSLGFVVSGAASTASTGDITNNSGVTQNISLTGLTLGIGTHIISDTSTGSLNISAAITESKGSVAAFLPGSATINLTGSGLANDSSANGGLLGGWATFGGNNLVAGGYAALDASKNVIAYTGYTTMAGNGTFVDNAAQNVSITSNATGAAGSTTAALPGLVTHMNTLLFASNAANTVAETVTVGVGNTIILGQNGGVMNATGTGGNVLRNLVVGASATNGLASTGGIMTAGDGINPATITFSGGIIPTAAVNIITVNSAITDNATVNALAPAPVSVTIDGGYVGIANTANSYSGGTYVLSGRVNTAPTGSLGSGPVYILPGGIINTSGTFANNFFISGNGSLEQPPIGLGALRLFGAGAAAGNLKGTVTLMGDAEITATNTSVPMITGQITGTGNLILNRTNGSQQGGTINIGSNTAAAGTPNNYTGDTILSAPTAGTGNGGLEIIAPLTIGGNDNIMPHGLTGSYLGGTTGNLVFDASASGHNAIFDLNGTTQTVNGLSNTNTMPTSDIITSSGGLNAVILTPNLAVLVVGDSNASGNFSGTLQDGVGQLAFRKIGSGTQVLSGSNNFSGDTNVNGGTLVANNSLSSGNININTTSASTTLIANGNFNNIILAANNGTNKATLSPGAASANGSIGAITASSLTVNGGVLAFDLSATPGTGDTITVNGATTFNAAPTLVIHGGSTGAYTLVTSNGGPITYGAGVTLATPTADPLVRPTSYTLDTVTNPSAIVLNVVGGPQALTWSGTASATWDINNTSAKNFTSSGADVFFNQDTVTFTDGAGNRTITISGSVVPAAVAVNANTGTDYTFSGGTIDGTTALTKTNGGNLTLTSNNTYSGGTNINAGIVTVGNNTTTGSLGSGNITFTNGSTPADLVFARTDAITVANNISGLGNVTIGKSGGTSNVTLTSANTYSGATVVSPGSTLVIAPNASISSTTGVSLNGSTEIISGTNASANFGSALTVGANGGTIKFGSLLVTGAFGTNAILVTTTAGGNLTIDINDATDAAKTYASAAVFTGGGNIIATNSLGNPNNSNGSFDTFNFTGSMSADTGNLTVGGALRFTAATASGLPTGNVSVASGAQVSFGAAGTYTNNFSIAGAGTQTDIPTLGALRAATGSTFSGNIALTSSALITVGTAAANTLVLNGQISGSGTLTLASGTFTLADLTATPSSYGPTSAGSTATIIGNILGRPANVTLNDTNSISPGGLQLQAGNLLINSFDIAFANLSSAAGASNGSTLNGGNITNAGSTTNTLSFGSDNSSQSFAGIIGDGSSGGFLNVTKNGTGTETFSGNNTYSGTTTINAGGALAIAASGSLSTVTPVIANGTLNFANAAQALASLNGPGAVNLNTTALTINGTGVSGPIADNATNASVIVTGNQSLAKINIGGTLAINNPAAVAVLTLASNPTPAVSKISALSLAGTSGGSASAASTWTAGLDLTNSKLIIEDSSATRAADLAQIQNEALAANTIGNVGIFSSSAQAFNTAAGKTVKVVAVVDNTVRMSTFPTGSSNFGGTNNVDANSILVTAAFKGDANLDGVVDIQDLTAVANHWQSAVTDWSQGDFDGSNFVDIQDLTAVANNWQDGVSGGGGSAFGDALAELPSFGKTAAAPEPASLTLFGLGGAILATRRRNKK